MSFRTSAASAVIRDIVDGDFVEINPLPTVQRRALWHADAGLVVSASGRDCTRLPANASDHSTPSFLDDAHAYLAFYPSQGPSLYKGLFSILGKFSPELLTKHIKRATVRDEYVLSSTVSNIWWSLECSLIAVADTLLSHHPDKHHFPTLTRPRFPHEYGYMAKHSSFGKTLSCARRALDSFRVLFAYTTFALALWIQKNEHDAFDQALYQLGTIRREALPCVWLEFFKTSIICNITVGLRIGGFLNPYTTRWGPFVERFTRAGVSIWFIWGENSASRRIEDPGMEFYFPPPEIISAAYEKFTNAWSPVCSLTRTIDYDRTTYSPRFPWVQPVNAGYSTSYEDGPWRSTQAPEAPSQWIDDPASLAVDPTQKVYEGSLQRSGENWEDFKKRMSDSAALIMEKATEQQIQRFKSLEEANKHGPTKTSSVYVWEQDEVMPAFFRRTLVLKSEAYYDWKDCAPSQRHFWPHLNQWDLLMNIQAHLPTEVPPTSLDSDDDEGDCRYDTPPEKPLAPMMLSSVHGYLSGQASNQVGANPADATAAVNNTFAYNFDDILTYLRKRHGFSPLDNNWHPDLHPSSSTFTKLLVKQDKPEHVIKDLLHSTHQGSLQITQSVGIAIIDWHNMALSPKLAYENLPPSLDIAPTGSLSCMQTHIQLQRVTSTDKNHDDLYVLRPARGSKDDSNWFVATTSATTVLLVYREGWTTMYGIASGLLTLGIPFRTVVEKPLSERIESPPVIKSIRLGRRPQGFEPSKEDYLAYKMARDDVLRSASGRIMLMQGGIVGRLAAEVVPDYHVLNGPNLVDVEQVGHHGNIQFVDDRVRTETLDIVCGVYHVSENRGGSITSHSSWWPKQSVWMYKTGLAGDQWLPDAEAYYLKKRTDFEADEPIYELKKSTQWKDALIRRVKATRRIISSSEEWARTYIGKNNRFH